MPMSTMDDEETEMELQDTLKEPTVSVPTSATSENATMSIIKPFQKAFSVEATSTTGTVCCVAFEIYLVQCLDLHKVEKSV